MKYKLDLIRDVDSDGGSFGRDISYILNLPHGFRFYDEIVHVRGFDSMKELRAAARRDVVKCDCFSCKQLPLPLP